MSRRSSAATLSAVGSLASHSGHCSYAHARVAITSRSLAIDASAQASDARSSLSVSVSRALGDDFGVHDIRDDLCWPGIRERVWCIVATYEWHHSVAILSQRQDAPLTRVRVVAVNHTGAAHDQHASVPLRACDVESRLRAEVVRLCVSSVRRDLRRRVANSGAFSPLLRRALDVAIAANPPIRSITALCSHVPCSRSALWASWRSQTCQLRLEDFVDWLVLLDGVAQHASGLTWLDVSTALEVHEHTLQRMARRLAGASLSELASYPSLLFTNEKYNLFMSHGV